MKQAQTAIEVYHHDIEPDLARRQQFVRDELQAFHRAHHYWPTALELLRHAVQRERIHFAETGRFYGYDVNTIRPRLTELWQQGWVARHDKRPCAISGKTVFVGELKEKPTGLF